MKLGGSFGEKHWDSPGPCDKIRNLTSVLLVTGVNTIVEAHPYDSYWGAGCSATDAIAITTNGHGINNIGDIPIRVREKLRLMLSGNS